MPTNRTTGTATSRARTIRPAVRKATKARLAISGPTGAGKTWTALCVADVLMPGGRTLLIDTERSDDKQSAAELYAQHFRFDVLEWFPPYSLEDLTITLKEVSLEYDVIIIDSATHFWTGMGGTLDTADGKFGGWREARPQHAKLIDTMMNMPCHLICNMRAKMEHVVTERTENGRTRQDVQRVGMAPIQDGSMEYEFQVAVMLDQDHRIDIAKTRCHELAGKHFGANEQGGFAKIYADWCERGESVVRNADLDVIRMAVGLAGEKDAVTELRRKFKAEFGELDKLVGEQLDDVWGALSAWLDVAPHRFEAGDGGMCLTCDLPRFAGWHEEPVSDPETPAAPAVPKPSASRGRGAPTAPQTPLEVAQAQGPSAVTTALLGGEEPVGGND